MNQIDMLRSPRCGYNAAIETKDIPEELREYFINKGAISWQRKQSARIFKTDFFARAQYRPL